MVSVLVGQIACDGPGSSSDSDGDTDSTETEGSDGSSGGDESSGGDGYDDGDDWDYEPPCEESRALLVVMDADGGELWRHEREDDSSPQGLVPWADGSWVGMIWTGAEGGRFGLHRTSATGEELASADVQAPFAEGALSQTFESMLAKGTELLVGGRSGYVEGGDATGFHAPRIDRFDGLQWQDGLDISARIVDGDTGVIGMAPDGAGGVYLHGGACESPCGAWLERRSSTLERLWRIEWGGAAVAGIAARSDGSVVVAVRDSADAETLGAQLMTYSPEGEQLWSRPHDGDIETFGVTASDALVLSLRASRSRDGTRVRLLALHDDMGEVWQQPREYHVQRIGAHETDGFVLVGEQRVSLHATDGTLRWEHLEDEAEPMSLSLTQLAIGSNGNIAVAGSRRVSCD